MTHITNNRREFFGTAGLSIGAAGLASLLAQEQTRAAGPELQPHATPKAKAVIYLFMAGGPSQLELFEDKPKLTELNGQIPPESFMKDRRFAFLKGTEKLLGSRRKFAKYGETQTTLSDLLPHHQKIADEVC